MRRAARLKNLQCYDLIISHFLPHLLCQWAHSEVGCIDLFTDSLFPVPLFLSVSVLGHLIPSFSLSFSLANTQTHPYTTIIVGTGHWNDALPCHFSSKPSQPSNSFLYSSTVRSRSEQLSEMHWTPDIFLTSSEGATGEDANVRVSCSGHFPEHVRVSPMWECSGEMSQRASGRVEDTIHEEDINQDIEIQGLLTLRFHTCDFWSTIYWSCLLGPFTQVPPLTSVFCCILHI